MKVQALNIQVGEHIVAYCDQKMQTCTVRQILELGKDNITLLVFKTGYHRRSASHVVRFRCDTLIEMAC